MNKKQIEKLVKVVITGMNTCKCFENEKGELDFFSKADCKCDVDSETLWDWISNKIDFVITELESENQFAIYVQINEKFRTDRIHDAYVEYIASFYTRDECEAWLKYEIYNTIKELKKVKEDDTK